MKNNKAVTLISLIITIIILLILARISLSMLIGNGEIFNKAKIASIEGEIPDVSNA